MTTHAKHANGDLHGGSTRGRLVKLLQRHEAAATAIRTTLLLLDGDAAQTKTEKAGDVLHQAIKIDTVRAAASNGNGSGRPAKAAGAIGTRRRRRRDAGGRRRCCGRSAQRRRARRRPPRAHCRSC